MSSIDPEDLLVHAVPLRRLARRLVQDEASADDLCQETWLAAWRRPPRADQNPLGWLSAVARNLARRRARDEGRRRDREARVAHPENKPSAPGPADEVAARARMQRELTDRLLALPEHYRAVLLYRYFDDLPPRRIAERLGLPVSTVNTRLYRGRQALRRALTERYGDRNAWCLGLVAWVASRPTAWRGWPLALPKLAAAAAALLVLSLGGLGLHELLRPRAARALDGPLLGVIAREVFEGPGGHADAPAPGRGRPIEGPSPHPEPSHVGISPETPSDTTDDTPPPVREPHGLREAPVAPPRHGPPDSTWTAWEPAMSPPGLVAIAGGATQVGSDWEELMALSDTDVETISAYALELPRRTVQVPDHLLMVSEVTNEQYEAFVHATGHRPPLLWSPHARRALRTLAVTDPLPPLALDPHEAGALAALWRAWEESTARAAVDAPGDPQAAPDRTWPLPASMRAEPVVFVDQADARAYARWAGLRLMQEQEFQRAARRDSHHTYPWGDRWRPKLANAGTRRAERARAGRHPRSAVHGVHDLIGNVWEWTDTPYPNEPPTAFQLAEPPPDAVPWLSFELPDDHQILCGGGYLSSSDDARIGVRGHAPANLRTAAVGFRCAADAQRAAAAAQQLARQLRSDLPLEPTRAALVERWSADRGAKCAPGYAVIRDYARLLFVPTTELAFSAEELERRLESATPLVLGVLSLERVGVPGVASGAHLVAWIRAGTRTAARKLPRDWRPAPGALSMVEEPGDAGALVLIAAETGAVTLLSRRAPRLATPSINRAGLLLAEDGPRLQVHVNLPSRSPLGLHTTFELRPDPNAGRDLWR